MNLVDQLLSGPRGRRLCLAAVARVDEAVAIAVSRLGYSLDVPAPRKAFFGDTQVGAFSVPRSTEAEVAERIRRVDLALLSAETIRGALGDSVDSARYWQSRDADDQVAALPTVREALRRVAELVVNAMPSLAAPYQSTQWAVDWRPLSDAAPLTDTAAALDEWSRRQRLDEEQALRDRPKNVHANVSGDWWSVPWQLLTTRPTAPDALRLVEDSSGWEVATVIPVRGAGLVREITTSEDWAALCHEFPLDVTASRRHDWFRVTGRDGKWLIPDWSKVAKHWDAVHLTTLGYLSGATKLIPVDDDSATMIAGWAPDSTVWLSTVAREWEEPRQQWIRKPNEAEWHPDPDDCSADRAQFIV